MTQSLHNVRGILLRERLVLEHMMLAKNRIIHAMTRDCEVTAVVDVLLDNHHVSPAAVWPHESYKCDECRGLKVFGFDPILFVATFILIFTACTNVTVMVT